MKFPWTGVACTALCLVMVIPKLNALSPSSEKTSIKRWTAQTEEIIKERLQALSLPFEAQYDVNVRNFIKRYTTYGYKDAQAILGRTVMYFPIFEHYLKLEKLPLELRYLPLVESSMRPWAKSSAGAAGLWQFMRPTARELNLQINQWVDERRDPYRSTEAAVKMLKTLHKQYGNWPLALAAYNCGPGTVNKAVRQAGCKDYWTVKNYLPKETQKYVPAFIAATYLGQHYSDHGLQPKFPKFDLQETRTVKVYKYMRLKDIAYVCDVDVATLSLLNPGYVQGILPQRKSGNFLILPKRVLSSFHEYQNQNNLGKMLTAKGGVPTGHVESTYVVEPGYNIFSLASLLGCSVEDIMTWNNLQTKEVFVNQELILYTPSKASVRTSARP